ncbi:MAG: hypothetical protein R3C53_11375 [Pirellulaceae bacterium]
MRSASKRKLLTRLICTTCILVSYLAGQAALHAQLPFELETTTVQRGFDGEQCWVHARAGSIPVTDGPPRVVMTMQKLLLSGSDVFYPLHMVRSNDLGATWSQPVEQSAFARQVLGNLDNGDLPTGAATAVELLQPGDETTVCDFTPQWHRASQRLLGVGQTVWYRDNRVMSVRPRGLAYAVFGQAKDRWGAWQVADLPDEPAMKCAGAGSAQRVDLPGGDVLIPIYAKRPTAKQYFVTVCRFRFDGRRLEFIRRGNELTIPVDRGLYEPSLTQYQGRFYLTIRNDQHGYVSVSDDGLEFDKPRRWTFDDGQDLGNYNTQQHWVTHSEGLYLVYTRRGAENDHVFRHRAPLFIAQVDPVQLHVMRDTEQVLVAERGARLGNFGVVDVSPDETWVTVAEWMQPAGVEQHGSDNSVFVAKLKWNQPNRLVEQPQSGFDRDENWRVIEPYFAPPVRLSDDTTGYPSPLQGTEYASLTPGKWPERRAELLNEWHELLGPWPELIDEPEVEVLESQDFENYAQLKIRFRWTPNETTTGYILVPPGVGPHPAVLSVYYEPETAIGAGAADRDFALQAVQRGFVAMSIGTTEATQAKTYALYYPSLEDARIEPLSMLAYAAANA